MAIKSAYELAMERLGKSSAPKLTGREQHRGGHKPHRRSLLHALQQQPQGHGGGVRGNYSRRKQVHGRRLCAKPRRPHKNTGLLVKRAAQVQNR